MIEAIKLVKSEWLDDWYTIERASHANVHGVEQRDGYSALIYSGRVSDACVEGSAEEMVEIAKAIRARGRYSAKRCAVAIDGASAQFWSPRNSMSDDAGRTTLAAADALAAQIEIDLAVRS